MNDFSVNSAWYTDTGIDNDVVLSTRVRLARNLSDFPFPEFMKNDSNERLLSVVFDAFSKLDDSRNYQALSLGNVEEIGRYILVERGVMPAGMIDKPGSGIIVSADGHISCTVNYHNHLHISSFIAGYSPLEAYNLVNSLDSSLQDYLQFAGNSEFGYFTSRLKDTGTGMKISAMLHLPSVVEAGLQDELFKTLVKSGFDVYAVYASYGNAPDRTGNVLGAWFRIATSTSFPLSETDQIAQISQAVHHIMTIERHSRNDLLEKKPTKLKDRVYRALANIKYSRYISMREGLELVSSLKWGLNLGMLTGVTDSELYALMYRIHPAHLDFVARSGSLSFEPDVTGQEQKIDRLRSLILQETAASIQFAG